MDISPLVAIIPVILAAALIITIVRRNITERQSGQRIDIAGAIPAFVILMVAVILIGGMAESVDDSKYELYDCVPLSSFGSGATIVGDCAEVVTIGGEQYVRMTSLGTFTATSGASSKEYKVTEAHLDLVVLSGQSNSTGYTSPQYYTDPSPVAPGKAFYLGQETGEDTLAGVATAETLSTSRIIDMVDSEGGVRVAQMYPSFCSDYVKETGHRVIVVNTGMPGKSIWFWQEGKDCDVWMDSVMDYLKNLVSDGSVVLNPTVALWSQGHADTAHTVDYYVQYFVPFLERLWDGDYSGYAFKNVLSVLPRHMEASNPTNPALAQIMVAAEYSGFTIASSLPVHFTMSQTRDGTHYTQTAYNWLGEAFARSAADVMGYRTVAESLVMVPEVGVVESLPAKVGIYGTSGETYDVTARWTVSTTDASLFTATFSNPPRGTTLTDGLTATAYPCTPSFFTFDSSGSVITGITASASTAKTLVLPTKYNGHTITGIGVSAFEGNTVIKEVATLSDSSLASVGQSAFRACTALETVDFPQTTTTYGATAFYSCTSLTEIELPYGTTSIPTKMFQGCGALESVTIPSTVTSIGVDAFRQCSSLESVSLPASLTSIGDTAFTLATGVTTVSFAAGFNPTLGANWASQWTFYDTDGTTVLDKAVASNLAGHTFTGTASALVKQS